MLISFSSLREGSSITDTAGVTLGKSDVTLFSPLLSPRVSDDPFLFVGTNKNDTVVKSSSTVVEDTTAYNI